MTRPRNPRRAYDHDGREIPPMTLGNMREHGGRSMDAPLAPQRWSAWHARRQLTHSSDETLDAQQHDHGPDHDHERPIRHMAGEKSRERRRNDPTENQAREPARRTRTVTPSDRARYP